MKQDSKFNNFIEKFKELWSIPRYKALIKLALWIVFFVFVSLYINSFEYVKKDNSNNDNNDKNIKAIEKYKEMNNYNFILSYKGKEDIVLTGKSYLNRVAIMTDTKTYYLEDNKIYSIKDGFIDQDIDQTFIPLTNFYLRTSDIYNLISLGKLDEEIKKIQDNTLINKYIVTNKAILKHYQDVELQDDDDSSIIITTYEHDGQINKIIIDFTSFKRYAEFYDDEEYVVMIEYSEINNILPFRYYTKTELTE